MFAIFAVSGALVSFHAIRARYRLPDASTSTSVKSHLFFSFIVELSPDAWAKSFLSHNGTQISQELKIEYFKNYITESYLIASKVADKMRYLEPAQQLLSHAIKMLVFWFPAYALSVFLVPPFELEAAITPERAVFEQPQSVEAEEQPQPVETEEQLE